MVEITYFSHQKSDGKPQRTTRFHHCAFGDQHYKNIFSAYAVNYMPLPLWWCLAAATMIFETGAIFLFTWKRTRVPIVMSFKF